MELQDGYIVGIFNYCDSWCEACAFTSRCRVFAAAAEHEAALDPTLRAVTEAPLLPEEDPEPPSWMKKLIQTMNEASQSSAPVRLAALAPFDSLPLAQGRQGRALPKPKPLPREHQAIHARACGYGLHLHGWLIANEPSQTSDPADPRAVVGWFSHFIGAKVDRALRGLVEDDRADGHEPADYEGSAKIALIGIERSQAAWLDLVAAERVPAGTAEPFIADLIWLGEALDAVFPNARRFIRPGFDEPDDVAKLEV